MTAFMPAVKASEEPSSFKEPRLNDKKICILSWFFAEASPFLPCTSPLERWSYMMRGKSSPRQKVHSSGVGPDPLYICWEFLFSLVPTVEKISSHVGALAGTSTYGHKRCLTVVQLGLNDTPELWLFQGLQVGKTLSWLDENLPCENL